MNNRSPYVLKKRERFLDCAETADSIAVQRVAHETWGTGSFQRSSISRILLAYCLQGGISSTVDGQKLIAGPGDVFMHMPLCVSHMEVLEPTQWMVVIGVGTSCVSLVENGLAPEHVVVKAQGCPRIRNVFEMMLDIAFTGGAHMERRCAVLLEAMLLELQAEKISDRPFVDQAFLTWIRCKDFIDGAYEEVCTIAGWAEACAIDRSYLSRLAQRYQQGSAQAYLQRLRLAHAAERLVCTNETIADISEKGGWSSPFSFSRAFRREYGLPPGRWRLGGGL